MENTTKSMLKDIKTTAALLVMKIEKMEQAAEKNSDEKQPRLASLLCNARERLLGEKLLAKEEEKDLDEVEVLKGMKKVAGFIINELEISLKNPKKGDFYLGNDQCLCAKIYIGNNRGYIFPGKWKHESTDTMIFIIENELRARGILGKVLNLDISLSLTAVLADIKFWEWKKVS
mgnify:CR=1 FL=1